MKTAWEYYTPFGAIEYQFGLTADEAIGLIRSEMTSSSYRMGRKRISGRDTKHCKKRNDEVKRFVSSNQY